MSALRRLVPSACLLLAACGGGGSGGGGGGGGGGPPPTNTAPVFTSPAAVSIVENRILAYQAAASDVQGNPLVFSISGGADAARFTITPAGLTEFQPPPNFDLPGDADGDNIYRVQLAVSDGSLSSTLDLAVTVTNDKEGLETQKISEFTDVVTARMDPTQNTTLYVAERGGNIYRLSFDAVPAGLRKTLLGTVTDLDRSNGGGLLGIVRSPLQFSTLFAYVKAADGSLQIRRIRFDSPPVGTVSTTLVTVAPPGTTGNYGGWMAVDADNNLYLATGDGGGSGDPANNAQNVNSRLGKILKFKVVGASTLTTAAGSPFFAGGDPYVWAVGLHDPRGVNFDNGMTFADRGESAFEEINRAGVGLNFGWPFLEGTHAVRGMAPIGLTPPLSMYPHGLGPRQGSAIAPGVLYISGHQINNFGGSYVFGDSVSGHIWSANPLSTGTQNYQLRDHDFAPATGAIERPVAITFDGLGRIYIFDQDGEVFMAGP